MLRPYLVARIANIGVAGVIDLNQLTETHTFISNPRERLAAARSEIPSIDPSQ